MNATPNPTADITSAASSSGSVARGNELSKTAIAAFLQWWHRISSREAAGGLKAERAQLRRCSTITEIVQQPAFHRAYQAMRDAQGRPFKTWQQDRVALLIGLAVHVQENSKRSFAQEMSQTEAGSDRPCVSELRFRRILESPDNDSLLTGLRRALPLTGERVDVASLARDMFQWNDAVKRRWAYAYFAKSRAVT